MCGREVVPRLMAALRNAAIGLQRLGGVTASMAETLRRNAARVQELFAHLGILSLALALGLGLLWLQVAIGDIVQGRNFPPRGYQ